MAEMQIRLRCDPVSGKRDIIVTLHGEEDMLPHEHEQLHRRLVDRLIEGGLIIAGEGGNLVVERLDKEGTTAPPLDAEQPQPQRESVGGNV